MNERFKFKTGNGPDMSGPQYERAMKSLYALHGHMLTVERKRGGPKRRRRRRS